MSKNLFELQVENKLENLPVISDFVEETLTRFGTDPGTLNRIQLAIEEAATNVINYAYAGGSGNLKLVLEMAGDELNITLIDWGIPFDPNTVPDPNVEAELDDRKIGGLGIYFMRKLMDSVDYTYDTKEGNQLRMKKKIPKKDLN